MHKTSQKLSLLALAGLMVATLTVTSVEAQTTTRRQNLEVNRDSRNMKLRATSTLPTTSPTMTRMATSTRPVMRADMRGDIRVANWVKGPNVAIRLASTTLMRKFATSTELRDHKNWKDTSLERFAFLHNKLVAKAERSLGAIKELRTKIGDRIQSAESNGRNMTDAKALLIKADEKIVAAEVALQVLVSYTPPVIASTTTQVSVETKTDLERPRALGKTAIDAIKTAKDALQEVIRAIAHDMGQRKGQNATSTNQNR